jgi:uncharacterized membrane protein
MIALVFLATFLFQLPIPATQGYFNFGDIMIFVAALTFGPTIGGVSGALGSALSDAAGGFGTFAPFTFLIKGTEGYVAGLISHRWPGRRNMILAWLAGSVVMVGGYFLAEWLAISLVFGASDVTGLVPAAGELPFNILQVVAGGIIGLPISAGVKYALRSTPYYSKILP